MIRKNFEIILPALLMIGLIGALTGCSSSPTSLPSPAATNPPATPPLELPTLVSTPTDSFSFISTPAANATPEAAPTPSYDWCKSVKTRLAQDDEIKMDTPPEDETFGAFVCLLEIVSSTDTDYPTQAIVVKIGLVDNAGTVHPYKAVIGGLIYKNPSAAPFEYPKCASQTTEFYSLDEYLAHLQTFMNPAEPKEFPVLLLTKAGLKYHWPPEASMINNYSETHLLIKSALESGSGFPEAPAEYQVFILPGVEECK